ncbi:MAG: flavodoxin [Firmicutes bacterium]|nr:flavodoxin [Bacillota bacterium]
MKAVVIYYSLEGNTERVAKMIAERTGAEIIALKPEKNLIQKGFTRYLWAGKTVFFKEKPKLLNKNLNLDAYDTIIIGTPIWAGTFAPPLATFLAENVMVNKNIYLFASHAGGTPAKCFANLQARLQGNKIKDTVDFTSPAKMDPQQIAQKLDPFCRAITVS